MISDTKGSIVPLAILIACGCLFAAVGCSKREIPSGAPKPTLVAWVPYTGQSMVPTFPARGLAEVEFGVSFSALKSGDIVVFWDYTLPGSPRFTLHRLVQLQGTAWIARGDNRLTNPSADRPWVTADNYVARATGRWSQLVAAPAP